jgi:hypothetical protein
MTEYAENVIRAVEHIVETDKARICSAVSEGLLDAASRCIGHHDGDHEAVARQLRNSVLDDATLDKLARGIFAIMTKRGVHTSPDKWNLDEYEPHVPADIAARIADGTMDLFDVCNSDIGRRKLDASYTEPGAAIHDIQISGTRLEPFSPKLINSVLCATRGNALITHSTGDNAKYVNALDYFDFGTALSRTHEVSIPTMLVTLNLSAKKPENSDTYFFVDHPENRVGGIEGTQTSGRAILGAVRIAETWNAVAYAHYNRPAEGSALSAAYHADSFSEDDVKASIGALAMLAKYQPEKTDKYMKLCYGHVSDPVSVGNVHKQLLMQHMHTVRSDEDKVKRLEVHDVVQQQKAAHLATKPTVAGIPRVRLSRVEDYKWEHPSDLATEHSLGKPKTRGDALRKAAVVVSTSNRSRPSSSDTSWRRAGKPTNAWKPRRQSTKRW